MSAPRTYVAGHRGLVGSAIVRRLEAAGHAHVLTATRDQVDLRDQAAVNHWFKANRPELVYLAAGTVGGILPNSQRPADFIYDNIMIHATVVHAAHQYGWSATAMRATSTWAVARICRFASWRRWFATPSIRRRC